MCYSWTKALFSIVRKRIGTSALGNLGVDKVQNGHDRQSEHHVKLCYDSINITCAVRMPFTCKVTSSKKLAQFHNKFGLIEGVFPFAIRLEELHVVCGTLSLKQLSVPMTWNAKSSKLNFNYNLFNPSSQLYIRSVLVQHSEANVEHRIVKHALYKLHWDAARYLLALQKS